MTSPSPITVEVAPGELIDKITILMIKSERITDEEKLVNVRAEMATLEDAWKQAVDITPELTALTEALKQINEAIWDIEDDIRDCERRKDFGDRFVELARGVYHSNDKRAAFKREVNQLLGSRLIEEKSYTDYQ